MKRVWEITGTITGYIYAVDRDKYPTFQLKYLVSIPVCKRVYLTYPEAAVNRVHRLVAKEYNLEESIWLAKPRVERPTDGTSKDYFAWGKAFKLE